MCNNPAYGVCMSPEAKAWLNQAYFAKNGISADELSEEQAEIVQRYVEMHFGNIKSLIIWMALQHEKPMHKGLSEPNDQLSEGL